MSIREATTTDFDQIWPVFREIAAAGETYTWPRDADMELGKKIWMEMTRKVFVVEENDQILASYYIKTNQMGPGDHVCNCGYMVSPAARGRGLARAMCEHSQVIARGLGYKAMQFNMVVETNVTAVKLWLSLGYETVGRLPKAFNHATKGYVDGLVMYKWLA